MTTNASTSVDLSHDPAAPPPVTESASAEPPAPVDAAAALAAIAGLLERLAAQLDASGIRRLAVAPDEAAAMLGVSRDFWDEHLAHEIRPIARGRRLLVPVHDLQRWLESRGRIG